MTHLLTSTSGYDRGLGMACEGGPLACAFAANAFVSRSQVPSSLDVRSRRWRSKRTAHYMLGDLTREQYETRKRVLQAELATIEPPIVADATEAAAALTNFGLFWNQETDPAEQNKILRLIFETVTVDNGRIVSVTPREAFLPYFQFGETAGVKHGSDGTPAPALHLATSRSGFSSRLHSGNPRRRHSRRRRGLRIRHASRSGRFAYDWKQTWSPSFFDSVAARPPTAVRRLLALVTALALPAAAAVWMAAISWR